MTRHRRRPGYLSQVAGSWIWALLPLATLGFATAPCMIFAAIRRRSLGLGAVAALYLVATATAFSISYPNDTASYEAVYGIALTSQWLVGGSHALAIRRWVFDLPRPAHAEPGDQSIADRQQAALATQSEQERARERARRIADDDPSRALALRIGRVDMPDRAYPDGGLVDINNVPTDALVAATGLPPEVCARIVDTRTTIGSFQSVAELSITLDLAPHLLDGIADRLIFLPSGR